MNIGDRVRVSASITYRHDFIDCEGTIKSRYKLLGNDPAWNVLVDGQKAPYAIWERHLESLEPVLPEDV